MKLKLKVINYRQCIDRYAENKKADEILKMIPNNALIHEVKTVHDEFGFVTTFIYYEEIYDNKRGNGKYPKDMGGLCSRKKKIIKTMAKKSNN